MGMRIAIHQPEFAPWLGFFHKMKNVDLYVVLDHVQFKKRYFENRNYIKNKHGQKEFLTIPVHSKGKLLQKISDVSFSDNYKPCKLLKQLKHIYGESHKLTELVDIFERSKTLMGLNLNIIHWARHHLKLDTPMIMSSTLNVHDYKASDLILEICKRTNAEEYLCGPSGKDYLNLEDFKRENVNIVWQEFVHPQYPQPGGFEPYLSCFDYILNLSHPEMLI